MCPTAIQFAILHIEIQSSLDLRLYPDIQIAKQLVEKVVDDHGSLVAWDHRFQHGPPQLALRMISPVEKGHALLNEWAGSID